MPNKKLRPVPEGNKGLSKLPTDVRNNMGFMKSGGKTPYGSSKGVKAPDGFHWMKKEGGGYNLMKHEGKFKAHKGATLVAKFDIQDKHKA